ncbi:CidA/LrgA family protein [Lyngbya confervoides]|uniref:CidA/LrgA family protein n=1 Tax=Lyngbya confervoides BDU141951 TaxID=1574623 RepID=A0ABD4SZE3_9CYAN|nr:CidA/LrgA family protein [Lyngbya confervoides]MCM1981432.1 CidA/LrgA family protein [Lyngbya confervoides BDU141951]
MDFLNGMTLLLVYQLMGEISVLLLKIPVPGPVMGMILLFLTLLGQNTWLGHPQPAALKSSAEVLLSHLSLLFVPAGAGVVVYINQIIEEWLPITIALSLSTILTLGTTALIMQGINHMVSKWRKASV